MYRLTAQALLRWAAAERETWLDAVTNDPLLPGRILPSDYLGQQAWRRHYVRPECGTAVGNREVAMKRLNDWLQGRPPQPEATGFFKLRKKKEETPSIICVGCEQRVPLLG